MNLKHFWDHKVLVGRFFGFLQSQSAAANGILTMLRFLVFLFELKCLTDASFPCIFFENLKTCFFFALLKFLSNKSFILLGTQVRSGQNFNFHCSFGFRKENVIFVEHQVLRLFVYNKVL